MKATANCGNPKRFWKIGVLVAIALVIGFWCGAAAASFTHYQHAAAAHGQANATLRRGILILAVPTLALFALIAAIVYRRRNVSR